MRMCKAQFHLEQQTDDGLSASIVLTEALLDQGKPVDAKRELDTTEMLARKSQNRLARSSPKDYA